MRRREVERKHSDPEYLMQIDGKLRRGGSTYSYPEHIIQIDEKRGGRSLEDHEYYVQADAKRRGGRRLEGSECFIKIDERRRLIPDLHYFSERTHHKIRMGLYKAAIEGDLEKAKALSGGSYQVMLRSAITGRLQTVLHVATGAKQTRFVREMIKLAEFSPTYLKLQDRNENNAFCYAVMVGAVPIAGMMLKENPSLLRIRGERKMTPLGLATFFAQRHMASFLFEAYESLKLEVEDKAQIFYASIRNNFYDFALKLLKDDEELAVFKSERDETALHMLARNYSAFYCRNPGLLKRAKNFFVSGKDLAAQEMDLSTQAPQLLECLLEKILEREGANIYNYMNENKNLIFEAAKLGNFKFLEKIIRFFPDLVRKLDGEYRTIFHIALLHRHVAVFNLINQIGDFEKQFIATHLDVNGNNLLHLAATYSNPRAVRLVPGAALEMQLELRIFEEVASLVMPSYTEMKNKGGLTPRQVFREDHKELLKRGEEWMKKTAESCMLVATIIATVVFSAAFTVPGEYNEKGIPRHQKNGVFCSFTLADAITLSSASISILLFLSILTSRYEEDDFLTSLPFKLMVGLLTLFISIATMMLSFSLSLFLSYSQVKRSYLTIPILICIFGFGPVVLFVYLQRRLLRDIFQSSFSRKVLL